MNRTLCLVALSFVLLAACKKDKKTDTLPPPTIYDQWILHLTAQPFATDTTWKLVRFPAEVTSFVLTNNGKYITQKYPDKITEGTYTIADSANTNIKVLTISNEGEPIKLYIQLLPSGELQMDDESIKNMAPGYVRRRFGRIKVCSVTL
ncbi:hypothetical protein [Chitinophaga niabensis]|uniref:Lipocalin-like domain-containing protein n=1 Tax=Chitinophaga niabensis TaxID=536979 RepID=A0A1N6J8F0_9BACT|nr:hypothetical protein [Chitinophaga niabensis]SIO40648.1 hypothetical protein SAMN04488055_3747 [Chitinophaga niabensis]